MVKIMHRDSAAYLMGRGAFLKPFGDDTVSMSTSSIATAISELGAA